jgi:hypothetical protein
MRKKNRLKILNGTILGATNLNQFRKNQNPQQKTGKAQEKELPALHFCMGKLYSTPENVRKWPQVNAKNRRKMK